jgi:uncharacterized glyoxalase superfamily protein PhnB
VTKLCGYLSYRDPEAQIEWLEAVGFETTTRQEDENGAVMHAELKLGDAVVMIAPYDDDYEVPPLREHSTGAGLYLVVDEVDQLHGRAVEAGGRSVFGPEKTEWGASRARVLDPEGREWSFGTYSPGES